ncbi:MAG: phosphatase PAP2 family protein [Deltaproteobacteria bacterium]|nr:phosphatase PAP2 family protein [Deltaproteobacteria bacterium]
MINHMRNAAVFMRVILVLMCILIGMNCEIVNAAEESPHVPEHGGPTMRGYLSLDSIPNIHELISPPPEVGSAAFAYDKEVSKQNLALEGTSRWELAAKDANQVVEAFSCVLNTPITEKDTPLLYMFLQRVCIDAGFATSQTKQKYNRPRPFIVNDEPICTPEFKEWLRGNGSYPSGHTACGWACALVLTEISPEYTDAILARGRAFGQSRVVCNVHWQSDVTEGRFVGAAVVARLHAEPTFRADIEAARIELETVRGKNLKPVCDCLAEAKALAEKP